MSARADENYFLTRRRAIDTVDQDPVAGDVAIPVILPLSL